ncbi:L-serine ammonia-lyase, iron-sulfur-dependent, subunit alpha [Latilactobacillus sakei]|uniref:L-serine dehydratase n=1 Tax=Latilactobacillus sakei TaxID=1599 RepID=A0AAX0V956_LATSK|nr:L-serine ammonia-lyase, iron-sulfur-dependent, subunit alpha [Latilactobacillus sakei]ASN11991.1 L-serine ammonia-lyase, iron-sulfur-dependent, subunit alpha [Latilactobacillus sakei]MCM1597784.1 L-serine ammonia-lyase, iron-sulfur-dependent, subunit alpha [Latilactobacillus sakei]MCM1636561.1 L-serine ammonia-lyase, iron-sulfur-dependent, subunit alpha [Latilactobacillus sakei]PKX60499.1 L-serine ammonia-lyase, iron-sulfur-dependent, subunit alpha [Latilactobacillus sakei]PKX69331.1 L-seri
MYTKIHELVQTAQERQLPISELIIEQEIKMSHSSREIIWATMGKNLDVMLAAEEKGVTGEGVQSATGITGGEAVLMKRYREKGQSLSGDIMLEAVQNAIATNEVNASMGIICATPTAGSAGTLPGILSVITKQLSLDRDAQIRFLFCASAFGMVVANDAMIAGATGGCQAEVGSASAMGAAAAVEVAGGTPQQSSEAFAMAMSNLLGLVCDPVAGLVEVPCVKRNVIGSVNALTSADMALAGLVSKIPADEVISAMKSIGENLPSTLRETGLGGLAATPTGIALKMQIFGQDMSIDK